MRAFLWFNFILGAVNVLIRFVILGVPHPRVVSWSEAEDALICVEVLAVTVWAAYLLFR